MPGTPQVPHNASAARSAAEGASTAFYLLTGISPAASAASELFAADLKKLGLYGAHVEDPTRGPLFGRRELFKHPARFELQFSRASSVTPPTIKALKPSSS